MSAEASIDLGLVLAIASAVGLGFYLHHLMRRMQVTWLEAVITLAGSTIFAFAAVLPTANHLGRADPARAPAVFWPVLVWLIVASGALAVLMRPRLTTGESIALAVLAVLPLTCILTPVGAAAGAIRTMHDCEGNLRALGTNFVRYVSDNGHWPSEDKWITQLLPYLPYPTAFRCPTSTKKDYDYHRPPPGAKPDYPLITCVHRFLRQKIVLHKDGTVTADELKPGGR
jgi:hypothetical protein